MTFRILLSIIVALAVPWLAVAEEPAQIAVPIDTQLALFVNIWRLDRSLDTAKPVTLAVLYQENYTISVNVKDDLLATIERQKLHIVPVVYEVGRQETLAAKLNAMQADAVYVTPLRGLDVAAIGKITRTRHLRTITGVPDYVGEGVAVGIGMRKDRPLIIIDYGQAHAEGALFSSQLLALARIVGPLP